MKISPPAFPTWIVDDSMAHGMSLRDYFANHAMVGFLASDDLTDHPSNVAKWSYEMADAMMRAREYDYQNS
jgi:hypothetical protein